MSKQVIIEEQQATSYLRTKLNAEAQRLENKRGSDSLLMSCNSKCELKLRPLKNKLRNDPIPHKDVIQQRLAAPKGLS